MLVEKLMKEEIGKLYARIERLEHLGRQMLGTMEILDRISSETLEEILEKWRDELGPKKGKRRVA